MSQTEFPSEYVANLIHFMADSLRRCDGPLDAYRVAEVYEGFDDFDFKVTVQLTPKKPQHERGMSMYGGLSKGGLLK